VILKGEMMQLPKGYKEVSSIDYPSSSYQWSTNEYFDCPPAHKLSLKVNPKFNLIDYVQHTLDKQPCIKQKKVHCFVSKNGRKFQGPDHLKGKCPLCIYEEEKI
jgi:hypothetical protein